MTRSIVAGLAARAPVFALIAALAAGGALVATQGAADRRTAAVTAQAPSGPSVATLRPLPTPPRTSLSPEATPKWKTGKIALNTDLGFWFQLGSFQPTGGSRFSRCVGGTDFCPTSVSVNSGRPQAGVDFTQATLPFHIKGRTLGELRRAWTNSFGEATFIDLSVDSEPAFFAHSVLSDFPEISAGSGAVVVLHAGRLFVLEVQAWPGRPEDAARGFINAFHFTTPECWLKPCKPAAGAWVEPSPLLSFDGARATAHWERLGSGFGFDPGPGDGSTESFVLRGDCIDRLCDGSIAVTTGSLRTGAIVAAQEDSYGAWWYGRIRGTTLDELAESWDRIIGRSTVVAMSLDGVPALRITGPTTIGGPFGPTVQTPGQVALVMIVRDRVVVVLARVGFLGPGPGSSLDSFLPGLRVLR